MTPRRVEWAWTCHFCRSHTMGVFIENCPNPECQHERCPDCKCEECQQPFPPRKRKIESNTFHSTTTSKQTTQICKEKEALTNPIPNANLPSFQIRDCRISEQQTMTLPIHYTNWRLDRGEMDITPSVSNSLPVAKYSKTATTPTSSASFSPTSTRTNELHDTTPSTFESPDTAVDSDGNESSSEGSAVEYDENFEDHTIRILERHVFSVLGNDLELAAKLIPQIYQCYMVRCDQKGAVFTNTPSHKTSDTSKAQYSPRKGATEKNLQGSISKSNLPKRGRLLEGDGDDDDDNGDDEGEDRGHKRPKLNIGDSQLRGFACPFYKKDKRFFNPYRNSRYKNCPGPGPEDFRHLRDHMMAAHGPRQCDKCYVVFAQSKQQLAHRKTDSCGLQQDHGEHLTEDISNELWSQIESLFKTRGRSRMPPDTQTRHSVEKWFEMWRFLFGDLQQPLHPYNEDPWRRDTSSPHPAHSPIAMSGDNLENLHLDEDVLQKYLAAMDTILEISRANSTSFDRFSQATLDPLITWPSRSTNEIFPAIPTEMISDVRSDSMDLGFLRDNGMQNSEIGAVDNFSSLNGTTRGAEVNSAFSTTVHTMLPVDQGLVSMLPPVTDEMNIGYESMLSGVTITGSEDCPLTDGFLNELDFGFEQFHQLAESANVNFSANRVDLPVEHDIIDDNAPSLVMDNNVPVSNGGTVSMLGIEEELQVEGATSSWRGKNRRNIALKGKPGELPRIEDG